MADADNLSTPSASTPVLGSRVKDAWNEFQLVKQEILDIKAEVSRTLRLPDAKVFAAELGASYYSKYLTLDASGNVVGVPFGTETAAGVAQELVEQTRDKIWADQFPGYDALGLTDSSLAINTAIAAAAVIGNCDVRLTGTPRIDSPIILKVPESPLKRWDMPTIVGSGMNDCVIKPTFAGKAVKIRGLVATNGTGNQSGTYFFWGGGIRDLCIDGSLAPRDSIAPFNVAPFNGALTDGIEIMAVWQFDIQRVKFRRLRHGIHFASDPLYNPNPDWSAAGKGRVTNCHFERITGLGIWNENPQGAPSMDIHKNTFVLCGTGGILCKSSAWDVYDNGFIGMGWVDEAVVGGSVNGYCLTLDSSAAAKIIVRCNEFDGSREASVRLVNCGSAEFVANRHVVRGYLLPSSPDNPPINTVKLSDVDETIAYPKRGYYVGPVGGSDAPRNVRVWAEDIRLDKTLPVVTTSGGVPGPASFTWADFAQTANAFSLWFMGPYVSRQVVGNFTFKLQTGAHGVAGANMHLRNDFRWFGVFDTSVDRSSGRPAPRFAGTIAGTPASPTVETALNFDVPDQITTQIYPTLYSSGIWTAQANELHDIGAKVAVIPAAAGNTHTIRLRINGANIDEESLVATGTHRHFLRIPKRSYMLVAGDTVEIRMISNVAGTISGTHSWLEIQQRGA